MNRLLLTTTAITVFGSMSHAQDVSYRQLGQLMTVTGGNDQAAFAIGPEWSEELGFSVTGRAGFMLGQGAALGVIGEIGENVTEGMVNLGFNLSDDMAMIVTAGQLRERLLVGDTGDREWVAQDEFGLAINGENLAFNAYYVDSASTENFIGAVTYGAEVEGSTDLADNATLSASLGYQRMEWDGDTFEALEEVTGSVDLAIDVTDTFRFNTFADYNVSEAQAGIGASWNLGAGTLDLDYTYVQMDDLSGLADDHRVGLTFSMPLGGGVGSVASRDRAMPGMVTASTQGASRGAALLAEVMRRPEYLPERVIVRLRTDGSGENGQCSEPPNTSTFQPPFEFNFEVGAGQYPDLTAGGVRIFYLTVRDVSGDTIITQEQITEIVNNLVDGVAELIVDGLSVGEWALRTPPNGGREFTAYFLPEGGSVEDSPLISPGFREVRVNFKDSNGCVIATHYNASRNFFLPEPT